ncbi:CoA-binding protein [Tenacibaculum sp. 1B UA]|uniref:CoA-binding protein n=1 Tax=unclassified Tenacibaculum TaxID=2635139 RepID=UPI0026E1D3E6|nr:MULTISPECIES: CoA-binding protein [unclassified Tenacibaculum]MDO6674694.1 CoA-binding protein [Tenacibaculum sp. 1_MG-2023]MDX8553303.1 CoA-binding protein [Tenacibaculum sp. 1B UA]
MKKRTLVLGASLKPSRYSNIAIKRLRNSGIETVAIGLQKGSVANVAIETENIFFEDIDTVTLYLNPKRQKLYYEYIIYLQPCRVIFNPGTENTEFIKLLKENGIESEIACTLVLLSTKQY